MAQRPTSPLWLRATLVGTLAVAVIGSTLALARRDYTFFDPIIDVERLVVQRYVTEPDTKAMQTAAIRGMIDALNDPYTVYIPEADTREFNKELTGDFVGIGVQVVLRDEWLTVVTPLEGSPAFRAGVMAEDRIVEIEGRPTLGISTDDAVSMLTGQPGTPVTIVVERAGQRITKTIVRQRIIARTVKGFHFGAVPGAPADAEPDWNYLIDPQRRIAYIRFTQFTPTSADEITAVLERLGARRGELAGLVLDLRWNPGGVLTDAVRIADLFLDKGVIVSTRGRTRQEEVARAVSDGTLPDFPLALLINSGSASASEVLAGALVEAGRAVAIGTRTFGKGSVQSVITLPSGHGQLKITEQLYYLPSGRSIHRSDASTTWGVDPSPGFFVPMTEQETRDMLEVRRREEVIDPTRPVDLATWTSPDWIAREIKDPQLAAAIRAIQLRVDTGSWVPTGQPLPEPTAQAGDERRRLAQLRTRMERELMRIDRRLDAMGAVPEEPRPVLPEDLDLVGGRIEVFDRNGKPIRTLRIVGPGLPQALRDADVRPDESTAPAPKP